MFFPRLRRHAKWMFLFLALAFGLGFIGFGVGAGGIGVGDIFRGGAGSGVPSASDAQERIDKNPKDAKAFRDLSAALQADNDTDGAIQALEDYVALRPKDASALRDLASLYLGKVDEAQQRAQISQLRSDYLAPGGAVLGSFVLGGRPLDADPINEAVSSAISEETNAALGEAQSASQSAIGVYKRLATAAKSRTDKARAQLELAQVAQDAGDYTTAIAAYEKFLVLDPENPSALDVKRLLKQLRGFTG